MTIKFYCDNHCADFIKTEEQLIEQKQGFTHCAFCGKKLHIQNLDDIVKLDIEKKAEEYVNLWFRKLGIEYTCEMIMKHKDEAVGRIYVDILKRKGLMR